MRFQIRHPDSSEWQEIDETKARKLLAQGYRFVDLTIKAMKGGQHGYTPTGSQIRVIDPESAPVQRREPEMREDGWINA